MNLSFKQAVHEILLCAVVFGCATVPICAANAPATDGSVEVIQSSKKIFAQVEALVKQYYPHAKMSEINQRLHIEYKVRNYRNLYSGRDELAPDQGGILADLEFKQGPYKGGEKLPKTQNQYSYMVLQLAPFLANEQQHISTKLCYAPDTSPDFVQQFSELLEDLARQQMAKGQPPEDSKPAVSVPVASPSATTTAATATAATATATAAATTTMTTTAVPLSATASAASSIAPNTVPKSREGRPLFLWKATRGKETVYVLGTIHIASANFYPLAAEIDDAFDQSKTLAVEVAIDKHSPDRKAIDQLVKDFGTYKSPDHLTKHLSPETRKILDEYLVWAGETIELYESYKPWYVLQLIGAEAPRRGEMLKLKTGLGLDRYFLKRATYAGTKVTELETLESQLHLHAGLSDDMQDKLLRISLLEYKDSQSEIKSIFDAWLAGNPEQLEQTINHSVHLHPELAPYMNTLLDKRNSGMLSKIDQLTKTAPNPIFVAVGAAHLSGKAGLIAGLKNMGFDVQQLQTKTSEPAEDIKDLLVFGDNRFKVWLPKAPQMKLEPKSRATQFEVADGDDRLYAVNILDLGADESSWTAPGPLALDAMDAVIIKNMCGLNTVRHSFKIQDFACRQSDFSIGATVPTVGKAKVLGPQDAFFTQKKPEWFNGKSVRLKSYLVGSKVYVQLVCGSKTFVDSPEVNKFMNSLKFIR